MTAGAVSVTSMVTANAEPLTPLSPRPAGVASRIARVATAVAAAAKPVVTGA